MSKRGENYQQFVFYFQFRITYCPLKTIVPEIYSNDGIITRVYSLAKYMAK